MYRNKLAEAANNANRDRDFAARAREEAAMMSLRVRELEDSSKDHQAIVDGLNRRVKVGQNTQKIYKKNSILMILGIGECFATCARRQ